MCRTLRMIAGLALIYFLLDPCSIYAAGLEAAPEKESLAVLDSEASHHKKAQACLDLALRGTDVAVPRLAALLGDPELGEYARLALERIPGDVADAALREALPHLEGRALAGVIHSTGVRRDKAAVPPLLQLLDKTPVDSLTRKAAFCALAQIASPVAVEALLKRVGSDPQKEALSVAPALLDLGMRLLHTPQRSDEALRLFQTVRQLPDLPEHLAVVAVYGQLQAAAPDQLSAALSEGLLDPDPVTFAAALRGVAGFSAASITEGIDRGCRQLPADRRTLLVQRILLRADAHKLPILETLLKDSDPEIRVAAIALLGRGDASGVAPLMDALAEDAVAEAAAGALLNLTGTEVSPRLIQSLEQGSAAQRLRILDILAKRGSPVDNIQPLISFTQDADEALGVAAFGALGGSAAAVHVPQLILALVGVADRPKRVKAAERCVVRVARRDRAAADRSVASIDSMLVPGTGEAVSASLLRILGGLGGVEALEVVSRACKDPRPAVGDSAIRILCDRAGQESRKRVEALGEDSALSAVHRALVDRALARLPAPEFIPLFDGKTFGGWNGPKDIFRIHEGVIIGGGLDKPVVQNEFMCTDRVYKNFELRLKCRLLEGKGNAGIQIRSRRIPNHHEMIGYQADMGQKYWGALYDESRRRKILASPDPAALAKVLKSEGWNDYVIRCEGPRIQLWLNGFQTVDYTEADAHIEQEGIIGLQIHAGAPSEVQYKDLEIRILP